MSDFKWQMQERIDAGMHPDEAYEATRDAYASAYDDRDKFAERHPEEVEYAKREKIDEESPRRGVYGEWCRDPDACIPLGRCPKDPTCGD